MFLGLFAVFSTFLVREYLSYIKSKNLIFNGDWLFEIVIEKIIVYS